MRITLLSFSLILLCCAVPIFVTAQMNHTLSGYVKDSESGETLIGANIHLENDPTNGTTTNTYGFYSITLPQGNYKVVFSYLGYNSRFEEINLDSNRVLNVALA